jgi:integrase
MRQRGNESWELRVYVGTDPDTHRRRWLSKTVHGTKRFARAQLEELVESAGRARLRAGTVADLLDQWFLAASPAWAPTTISQTRSIIDVHLKPHLGHLDIEKLTTVDIDDFYGYLLRAGGRRQRPLTPGTVTRIHGVLHRALSQAVRRDWIWMNPASNASPPRVKPADIRPPGPAEVVAILEWTARRNPPFSCFLRLAASTGARRSQLLALRWSDIDWERAAVSFTRALVEGPHGPELHATKNHRTYRVELDAQTLRILREHRLDAEARARSAGSELAAGTFVFSLRPDGGRPWLPNWATKQFIAALRAAGLPHFRLHDLRHFMATEMLAAGVPIATVSQRLSHARASTTLNVYAHSVPGGDRNAAETLSKILSSERASAWPGDRASTPGYGRRRDCSSPSAPRSRHRPGRSILRRLVRDATGEERGTERPSGWDSFDRRRPPGVPVLIPREE